MAKEGRPTKFTEQTVGLLEKVLKTGVSIETACDYVGIARDSYYDWIQKDSDFRQKMHAARKYLSVSAAATVAGAVLSEKNSELALKVLERKETGEFGVKEKIEVSGEVEHHLTIGDALKLIHGKKPDRSKPIPKSPTGS